MFELFDPQGELHISAGSNLPHWFQPGATYFVTWRTCDSMPTDVADRWHKERAEFLARFNIHAHDPAWKSKLNALPIQTRKEFHRRFSSEYLKLLDQGFGECKLKNPQVAKIVSDSLRHFDGDRYHLGDFVIMPNHTHLLVGLIGETDLIKQCYSWKKFTATKINKLFGCSGRFWQEESFDHLFRSSAQFDAIGRYIANNPGHLPKGDYYHYQRK